MASSLKSVASSRSGTAPPELFAAQDGVGSSALSSPVASILIVDDRQDKRLAMKTIIEDLQQNIVEAFGQNSKAVLQTSIHK